MKKLFLFCITTALFAFTTLHAAYSEFNIGKGVDRCTLSPDGKFLANSYYNSPAISIWNVQTGQLYAKLPVHYYNIHFFFSSDSKEIFIKRTLKINCYSVAKEALAKRTTIHLRDESFSISECSSYTCINIGEEQIFKKIGYGYARVPRALFLKTLTPDGTINTIDFKKKNVGFTHQIACACTITPDAMFAAIAYDVQRTIIGFVHCNLTEPRETIYKYFFSRHVSIISMNFSPHKTKFVCLAQKLYYGSKPFYVVIDLNTHEATQFKPSKPIRFAAFVNDTTVLLVDDEGLVSYYDISSPTDDPLNIIDTSLFT